MSNEKIYVSKCDLQRLYKSLTATEPIISKDEFVAEMKKVFGDALKPDDVRDRIKTFEDACNELGQTHCYVTEYNMCRQQIHSADLLAYYKLRIITAALNEGWEPKFERGEKRWYFWYELLTKEQYDKLSDEQKARVVGRGGYSAAAYCGLVYSFAFSASSGSSTSHGSRLAIKNADLASYAGRQFAEIYADFCFKPDPKSEM